MRSTPGTTRCGRGAVAMLGILALIAFVPACKKDEGAKAAPRSEAASDRGEPCVVKAAVDKAVVDIGDKVVYTVRVVYDPAFEVEFPAVLEQFENWVIFDAGSWKDEPDLGAKKVRSITVTLDPGIGPVLTIPPAAIRWKRKTAADWKTATTEAITVEVTSVAEKPGDFREPIDMFELPVEAKRMDERLPTWALIVGGASTLLFVLGLVLWLGRKKGVRPIVVLPPHEIAQRELAQLMSLGLLEKGEVKEFYYRLTLILRRYIEGRFGIMAPERTTEEFLIDMKRSRDLAEDHKRTLADFLLAADMVKYARFTPAKDEGERALRIAEQFVMTTIAAPAPHARAGAQAQAEAGHAL